MAKAIINGKLAVEQNIEPEPPNPYHHLTNSEFLWIAAQAVEYVKACKTGQPGPTLETFNLEQLALVSYYLWIWHMGTRAAPTSKAFYKIFSELVCF